MPRSVPQMKPGTSTPAMRSSQLGSKQETSSNIVVSSALLRIINFLSFLFVVWLSIAGKQTYTEKGSDVWIFPCFELVCECVAEVIKGQIGAISVSLPSSVSCCTSSLWSRIVSYLVFISYKALPLVQLVATLINSFLF